MAQGGCNNSNTVAELADETISMSKFCRVRGNEDDTGEVEVELEHDRLPGLQPVNWCRTRKKNNVLWVQFYGPLIGGTPFEMMKSEDGVRWRGQGGR